MEVGGDRRQDRVDQPDAHEGDHAGERDRPDRLGLPQQAAWLPRRPGRGRRRRHRRHACSTSVSFDRVVHHGVQRRHGGREGRTVTGLEQLEPSFQCRGPGRDDPVEAASPVGREGDQHATPVEWIRLTQDPAGPLHAGDEQGHRRLGHLLELGQVGDPARTPVAHRVEHGQLGPAESRRGGLPPQQNDHPSDTGRECVGQLGWLIGVHGGNFRLLSNGSASPGAARPHPHPQLDGSPGRRRSIPHERDVDAPRALERDVQAEWGGRVGRLGAAPGLAST